MARSNISHARNKLSSQDKDMEKTAKEKAGELSGSSEKRKATPYQRIVIACPDNHIIVVKRFMSGGKELVLLSMNGT